MPEIEVEIETHGYKRRTELGWAAGGIAVNERERSKGVLTQQQGWIQEWCSSMVSLPRGFVPHVQ